MKPDEKVGASTAEALLSVENVAKFYGEVKALRGINLRVHAGEFVALLGPNGAGKSTLLQLLTGLFSPDEGRIRVLGHDISRSATKALAGIGSVFQQQTLDLELSVKANLLYHADLHGLSRRTANERSSEAIAQYGLTPHTITRTLSGGNRRRVELARALLHKPRVLLMDEATVGLDPNTRHDLLKEIVDLKTRENLGVLWTTHLIDEIQYADRLILLDKGKVLYEGTAESLLRSKGSTDLVTTIMSIMNREKVDPDLTRDLSILSPADVK